MKLTFIANMHGFALWKIKKGITITNVFKKNLKESGRKSNKIGVDKGSEFYNSSMKSWLEKNDIEMYSLHNEGKYVVAERFIRKLSTVPWTYVASDLKNEEMVGTFYQK